MFIKFSLDGKPAEAKEGERLLDLLIRWQVPVPRLCYHEQLGPIKTCDACIVEVDGKIVRACETALRAEMKIATASARAKEGQKAGLDKALANHLLYCTVCDNNNGNCTVHNNSRDAGLQHQKFEFKPKGYAVDNTNPFYRYDPDQCILCGRCVEACQNIEVNETLSIDWAAEFPRVLWDGGKSINESSCVSCGHCVTACPCNALMEKTMIGRAGIMTALPPKALDKMISFVKGIEPDSGLTPLFKVSEAESKLRESRTKRTKTVCTYCGVGCSFDIWSRGREILKVEPNEGPANGISTCIKGKFGWDFVNSKERLTKPLIRRNGTFEEASWEEALGLVAEKFAAIKAKSGSDSLGFVASSKCTNEETFLMQKLARAVIGTNNVDNCSRYCQSPATKGLTRTVGLAGDTGSIQDITQADLVITIGSNTAESHPVIASRIKESHKKRGQKLVVVDIRKHEMMERADFVLQPNPGTDLIWISAITRYLLENGLANEPFLKEWVNGRAEYEPSLAPFTMEFASRECGLPVKDLETLAKMIAASPRVCILWAMGVTQHTMGSDTSTAISNLLLVTGNYMRPGTGAYPLRGHNNVQGAGDHGASPDLLPGYQKLSDPEARARFENVWKVKIDPQKGLDNHEMIDAIEEGKLKAMYVYGEEISLVESNANHTSAALAKLEFFVVQEIFWNATCAQADVVLPACPSLEKEGTFTNTERRVQRIYQAFEPLEGTKPDWTIIQEIANRLGARWNYQHPSEIYDEIALLCPLFRGINYDRLKGYRSLQWPVHEDGTDESLLYTKGFAFPDKKAKLHALELRRPEDVPNEEFDLHLNNGRVLEHFHEGTMTYRSPGIAAKIPEVFLEISPELSALRGIQTGNLVRLISKYGKLKVKVLVTDRVKGKQLYMPLNTSEEGINLLTGSHCDPITHTPAYKETSVRMEVLNGALESPLPKTDHRFMQRTPRTGVEVEKKWARADYHFPGGAPLPPGSKASE